MATGKRIDEVRKLRDAVAVASREVIELTIDSAMRTTNGALLGYHVLGPLDRAWEQLDALLTELEDAK